MFLLWHNLLNWLRKCGRRASLFRGKSLDVQEKVSISPLANPRTPKVYGPLILLPQNLLLLMSDQFFDTRLVNKPKFLPIDNVLRALCHPNLGLEQFM